MAEEGDLDQLRLQVDSFLKSGKLNGELKELFDELKESPFPFQNEVQS